MNILLLLKYLVFSFLIMLNLEAVSQNPKKLLTKMQLDSIENGFVVKLKVNKQTCSYFEGFQGVTKVKKIKGEIFFDFVSESTRFDALGRMNANSLMTVWGN